MRLIDITGQTFARWTVLQRVENTTQGQAQWLCKCQCGNTKVLKSILLIRGISKSCGCLKAETKSNYRHGHATGSISPTYHTWSGMVARCTSQTHKHFKHYGGRGIKVCDQWLVFTNFLSDMGEKPKGFTLDRIDVNGDYTKENCKWSTQKEQTRNKRNSRKITFSGETLCISAWAERIGISHTTLSERIAKWPLDKALTHPKIMQKLLPQMCYPSSL